MKLKKLNTNPTDKLTPYRESKVKVQDVMHTAICPVSLLYGNQTVRDTVSDSFTNMFVEDLLYGEILPTIQMDEEEKRRYAAETIESFKNSGIDLSLDRLARNSIAKFRTRNLPALIEYVGIYNALPQYLVFSLSALIVFYKGVFNHKPMPVNDDPSVASFFKGAWMNDNYNDICRAVLSNDELWDADLTRIEGLQDAVARNIETIDKYGIEESYTVLFCMEDLELI